MEDICVINQIKEICKQRGWSYYKLAQKSGIPHSSLSTMLNKQHIPSMNNLIKICRGFDIPLSEFFRAIEGSQTLNDEVINLWSLLDSNDRALVLAYMRGLAHKGMPTTLGEK